MTILAAIEDPAVIGKILSYMGLPTRAPPQAPARLAEFRQTAESPTGFLFSSWSRQIAFAHCPRPHPHKEHQTGLIREQWASQTRLAG